LEEKVLGEKVLEETLLAETLLAETLLAETMLKKMSRPSLPDYLRVEEDGNRPRMRKRTTTRKRKKRRRKKRKKNLFVFYDRQKSFCSVDFLCMWVPMVNRHHHQPVEEYGCPSIEWLVSLN